MICITKTEIVDKTWRYLNRIMEKKKVEYVINAFINAVGDEIKNGNSVKIEGLGSFIVSTKNEYIGKDIRSRESALIPQSTYIRFRPSKKIKPSKGEFEL